MSNAVSRLGNTPHSTTLADSRYQTHAAIATSTAAATDPAKEVGYGLWIPSLSVERMTTAAAVSTTSIGWCLNAATYASMRTIPVVAPMISQDGIVSMDAEPASARPTRIQNTDARILPAK